MTDKTFTAEQVEERLAAERRRIMQLLDGIDKTETESESGWWETERGAQFGSEVLRKIQEGEVK